MLADKSESSAALGLLQYALEEHTRNEAWDLFLHIGDIVSVDGDDCSSASNAINKALESFLDGTFAKCVQTTPTSTPTNQTIFLSLTTRWQEKLSAFACQYIGLDQ